MICPRSGNFVGGEKEARKVKGYSHRNTLAKASPTTKTGRPEGTKAVVGRGTPFFIARFEPPARVALFLLLLFSH